MSEPLALERGFLSRCLGDRLYFLKPPESGISRFETGISLFAFRWLTRLLVAASTFESNRLYFLKPPESGISRFETGISLFAFRWLTRLLIAVSAADALSLSP